MTETKTELKIVAGQKFIYYPWDDCSPRIVTATGKTEPGLVETEEEGTVRVRALYHYFDGCEDIVAQQQENVNDLDALHFEHYRIRKLLQENRIAEDESGAEKST